MADLASPEPGEIVLTAVGDALWMRPVSTIDAPSLQALFDVMRSSDVAFQNLEEAVTDRGFPKPKPVARADPSIVDDFVWAGIDVVGAANNHAMDYGPDGMETARQALAAGGIGYTGAGQNLEEALRPATVEVSGVRVAFLAFMVSPNFLPLAPPAGPDEPGVAPIRGAEVRLADGGVVNSPWASDIATMEEAIRRASDQADLVAVSLHIHWGDRDEIDPSGKQLIARAAVDAGADLIIGHGPLVLNGIELYKGKPILYSLGKFVFHLPTSAYELFPSIQPIVEGLYADERFSESAMVRVIVGSEGQIRRLELLPVELSPAGDPHFASDEMTDRVFERLIGSSEPLGTRIVRTSWFAVVDLEGGNGIPESDRWTRGR